MTLVVIPIRGKSSFNLLYSSQGFVTGLTVTGYLIYPDVTKSGVVSFDEIGDGIYSASFSYQQKIPEHTEKYGIVVKENGDIKYFGFIEIIN